MDQSLKIEFVWGSVTDALKKEVLDFWESEGAIRDEKRAKKRADELVAICRKSDELVGVVTHMKYFYQPLQNYFHVRRTFVKENFRNQGIMKALFKSVWDTFNEREFYKEEGIVGIMAVLENPILNARNGALWPEYGNSVLVGIDNRGFQIRASYFEGVELSLPKMNQGAPASEM